MRFILSLLSLISQIRIFGVRKRAKNMIERLAYYSVDSSIKNLKYMHQFLIPSERSECFDRYYIDDYVSRHKDLIKGDCLEFTGGGMHVAILKNMERILN